MIQLLRSYRVARDLDSFTGAKPMHETESHHGQVVSSRKPIWSRSSTWRNVALAATSAAGRQLSLQCASKRQRKSEATKETQEES